MSVMLAIFFRTRNIRRKLYIPPQPVTRGPWHADSTTWPTYLLLVTSIISCAATGLVMLMYLHSVRAANIANAKYSQLTYALFLAHVIVWIGTAIAYRRAKDGTDLWGWSCTTEAQQLLQLFFSDVVNFKLLCSIQVGQKLESPLPSED